MKIWIVKCAQGKFWDFVYFTTEPQWHGSRWLQGGGYGPNDSLCTTDALQAIPALKDLRVNDCIEVSLKLGTLWKPIR